MRDLQLTLPEVTVNVRANMEEVRVRLSYDSPNTGRTGCTDVFPATTWLEASNPDELLHRVIQNAMDEVVRHWYYNDAKKGTHE